MTVTSYLTGTLFPLALGLPIGLLIGRAIRRGIRALRGKSHEAAFELPDLGAEDLERKLLDVQQDRWELDAEPHPAASRRAREVLERRLTANRKAARALERKSASRQGLWGFVSMVLIVVLLALGGPVQLYTKWINGGDIWHGSSYTQSEHYDLLNQAR